MKRTSDQPVSTFSIDVDTATYANVLPGVDLVAWFMVYAPATTPPATLESVGIN